jgi:hypothetical protein
MASSTWKSIDIAAYALLLLGALNWGLVGFSGLDLVAIVFGEMTIFSRMIYAIVGIAAFYDIFAVKSIWKRWDVHLHEPVHT